MMKFNNLIDDYMQHLKLERGLSENSLNAYSNDLNEFYLFSKVNSPQSITTTIINDFLNYLSDIGIKLNKKLTIKDVLNFDKSMLIEIDGSERNISNTIAANIFVVRDNNY